MKEILTLTKSSSFKLEHILNVKIIVFTDTAYRISVQSKNISLFDTFPDMYLSPNCPSKPYVNLIEQLNA
jgi:hypothetical protein